jgi:hypothetical protein
MATASAIESQPLQVCSVNRKIDTKSSQGMIEYHEFCQAIHLARETLPHQPTSMCSDLLPRFALPFFWLAAVPTLQTEVASTVLDNM